MKTSENENGFTLVEILIALSIAVVGLLAILTVIISSLKDQQDSEFRRNAVTLAGVIADKMRANHEYAPYYDYFGYVPEGLAPVKRIDESDLQTPTAIIAKVKKSIMHDNGDIKYNKECDGDTEDIFKCDNQKIVDNDLVFWQNEIRESLPQGAGLIRRAKFDDNSYGNVYQIMIIWYERPAKYKKKSGGAENAYLDPECTFPTIEEKRKWATENAPKPNAAFANYRCSVVAVTI